MYNYTMARPTKRDNARRSSGILSRQEEDIICVTHQFPIVMRRQLIVGMLIILFGMLPWSYATGNVLDWAPQATWWMIFVFAILIFYWFRTWVSWYYSVYMLTSVRVVMIRQRGFFNRRVEELALNNVQNVNYHITGFQAALFGYGDIEVQTLSGSGGLRLSYVHHPSDLQQKILEAVHKHSSTSSGS